MGEIRIVSQGITRGYPSPVCKNLIVSMLEISRVDFTKRLAYLMNVDDPFRA